MDRVAYASEAGRVLRTGGEVLLRACLRACGVRNDISEEVLRTTFAGWKFLSLEMGEIPSDTRLLEALTVRLLKS